MFKGDVDTAPFSSGQLTIKSSDKKLRSPKDSLLKTAEQLARSRFQYFPVTVCMLDMDETAYVRSKFDQRIKDEFWQQLEGILTKTKHCKDSEVPFHDDLANSKSTIYGTMDLHHVIQISACPVSLYPDGDWRDANWDDVLKWWGKEAHKHLAAVPELYHQKIHGVQDKIIQLELGTEAITQERKSRTHIGDINVVMKRSAFWLPQQRVIEQMKIEEGPPPPSLERKEELKAEAQTIMASRSWNPRPYLPG